jgi:predicted peptidase
LGQLTLNTLTKILFISSAFLSGCAISNVKQELIQGVPALHKEAMTTVQIDVFQSGLFKASNGIVIPYRILFPSDLKQGKTYPLVLQLHGSGEIGVDNIKQVDRLAKSWAMPDVRERYQTYVLVPQFPIRSANYGPTSPDQKAEASPALHAALELLEDFTAKNAVNKSQIYALGFSMGGSATWLSHTIKPNLFAAMMPISGIAPDDAYATNYQQLPVLVLHGNADTENPITADRRFFNAIKKVGSQQIRLREYEGLAHQLPDDIYSGFWWRDWLFAQKRD